MSVLGSLGAALRRQMVPLLVAGLLTGAPWEHQPHSEERRARVSTCNRRAPILRDPDPSALIPLAPRPRTPAGIPTAGR